MLHRRICFAVLAAFVFATFQSTPATALVKFDFEQKFFTEPGQPVLDHFLLEEDGVYHLFYLRGNPALDVGHATSNDLVHWTLQPPVLSSGSWDEKLWAPHLVKNPSGNGWIMFYTGVNHAWSQQTGIAFSPDLYNWSKYPFPVYHPDPAWAEWSETYFTHGRDPDVIEDNGKYYLFNTAKTWTNQGAVAAAVSNDMLNWTDIGPAYVHYTWHVMESIFVMKRNSRYHMFFTEEAVNGTSHMWSDSLLSGWDVIANRRIIDLGHAPQVSTMSDGTEIFSRHSIYNDLHGLQMYTLRFDTLQWTGDIPAPSKPWPLAADWTQVEGNAFTFQPTFGNNPYVRGEAVSPTHVGNCWIGTKERYTGPLAFGSPGSSQGDTPVGVLRSKTFTIAGYSMNLLVGGSDNPDSCYVALVSSATGKILCMSTGLGVEEMDRRYWDTFPFAGKEAYIEIVDRSAFGHINVDDIIERPERLTQALGDGKSKKKPSKTGAEEAQQDAVVVLHQNTPNPFNPTTAISFELPAAADVTLDVFDVGGKLVARIAQGRRAAGLYQIYWDGAQVPSGVYFYRLTVDGHAVFTRKMSLLK